MKTLVIGIDGADWKIINHLIKNNKLPTISKLKRTGVWANFNSTKPIISPVVWTTIMTGKTRDKHGVEGFYTTAEAIKCYRVWDILRKNSLKAGTIGHLLTSPPDPELCFQVPGWISTNSLSNPEELAYFKDWERTKNLKALPWKKRFGFSFRTLWLLFKYRLKRSTELHPRYHLVNESLKTDIFIKLLKKHQLDFATIMFYGTDFMMHQYFHKLFPDLFTPEILEALDNPSRNFVEDMYKLVDKQIARILKIYKNEPLNIFIISDHGFTATPVDRTNRNQLKEKFFIKLLKNPNISKSVKLGTTLQVMIENQFIDSLKQEIDNITVKELNETLFKTIKEDKKLVIELKSEFILNKIKNLEKMTVTIKGQVYTLDDFIIFGKRSGLHALKGICIMNGPSFQSGINLDDINIQDFTPTLLHSLGIPVGKDMDGKVVLDAFNSKIKSKHVEMIDSWDSDFRVKKEKTDKDVKELEQRLKELGYL